MNGLSLYANRIAWTRSLAALIIGFALASGIFIPNGRGAVKDIELQLVASQSNEKALRTLLDSERTYSASLRGIVSDMHDKYELLGTFLDAGYVVNTPAEIRTLLDMAQDMPFGSPFSNGHKVTAQYGVYSIEEYGWTGVPHLGIDIVPLNGDRTIYSPVDGIITDFGISDIFGKYLEITTEAGYQLFFAHLDVIYWQTQLDNGDWTLKTGTPINKRDRIAVMGQTGAWATGPHLHYEIRIKVDGEWTTLDPEAIIGYTGAISDDNE